MDQANALAGDFATMSLADYMTGYWAPAMRRRVDPRTAKHYESMMRAYVTDEMKHQAIATIRRAQLKALLSELLDRGHLARTTVASVAHVLGSVFGCALDDDAIAVNPAAQIARTLSLRAHDVEKMKAMDAAQLEKFLLVASQHEPGYSLQLATLSYTGIRIGELRGLQISDVDLEARTVWIKRQVTPAGSMYVILNDSLPVKLPPAICMNTGSALSSFAGTPGGRARFGNTWYAVGASSPDGMITSSATKHATTKGPLVSSIRLASRHKQILGPTVPTGPGAILSGNLLGRIEPQSLVQFVSALLFSF